MKIIVTHTSPDLDAISSVWILKRYLQGWEDATVEYVPAGQRHPKSPIKDPQTQVDPIEKIGEDEMVHVDTGMGPLDHHQTSDDSVCGASRTWDYVKAQMKGQTWEVSPEKQRAIDRIIKVVVAIDHFKEVFWPDTMADYQEFQLMEVLDGLKSVVVDDDEFYTNYIATALDALVHAFENRAWAEQEIKEKGIAFETKWGKGIGFETINDTVLKLSQKMGYAIVLRKDPRKGYVRIKARPFNPAENDAKDVDFTLLSEKLHKIDPEATWFLHASKKMLLNGTPKNPKMVPTKLTLQQLIETIKSL